MTIPSRKWVSSPSVACWLRVASCYTFGAKAWRSGRCRGRVVLHWQDNRRLFNEELYRSKRGVLFSGRNCLVVCERVDKKTKKQRSNTCNLLGSITSVRLQSLARSHGCIDQRQEGQLLGSQQNQLQTQNRAGKRWAKLSARAGLRHSNLAWLRDQMRIQFLVNQTTEVLFHSPYST